MVAIAHPVIEEVFLRHGQLQLGMNPDAEPSLEDIRICKSAISDSLRSILIEDDVFSLKASYGDAEAGDPSIFEFLRIETSTGKKTEVEVFNLAILLFTENTDETRRLFRIINAIKGEQDVDPNA
jgi:hypothetical protein